MAESLSRTDNLLIGIKNSLSSLRQEPKAGLFAAIYPGLHAYYNGKDNEHLRPPRTPWTSSWSEVTGESFEPFPYFGLPSLQLFGTKSEYLV